MKACIGSSHMAGLLHAVMVWVMIMTRSLLVQVSRLPMRNDMFLKQTTLQVREAP